MNTHNLFPKSKIKIILTLSLIAIICFSSGAIYVKATGSSPEAQTISSGVYPGSPTYTVWTESGNYYAKDAYGTIDYTSTDASTIWSDVVATGNSVEFEAGAFSFGANVINIPNSAKVSGQGMANTIFNFTTGGVTIGSTSTQESYGTLESVTIQGTGAGQIGLTRVNEEYSTIRDVEITGFTTGFYEYSTSSGVNILNTGYNIHIENCVNGAKWDAYWQSGINGNNLNTYYGLWCYGSSTTAGSIGLNLINGMSIQIIGGWAERFDVGINFVNASTSKISQGYTETCNTHVVFGVGASHNSVDISMFWASPQVRYTDAGSGNNIVYTANNADAMLLKQQVYFEGGLIWLDTNTSQGGSGSQMWIGHDSSGNIVFNVPSSGGFTFRVNGGGVAQMNTNGRWSDLKTQNSQVYGFHVGYLNTQTTITFPVAETDTNYGVSITPGWNTTYWVTNKTVNSCIAHFGTGAPGGTDEDLITYFTYR